MSDVMLLGVLRMPLDTSDPLMVAQFVNRARQAADRIEADADRIERLRADLAQVSAQMSRAVHVGDDFEQENERLRAQVAALEAERDHLSRIVSSQGISAMEDEERICVLEAERDALLARVAELDPQPDEVRVYYMHEDHTFTRLNGNTVDELLAHADEVEKDSPYGMLCRPTLLRRGKEVRRVGTVAHSGSHTMPNTKWSDGKTAWRAAVEADADFMRLIGAPRGK